MNQTSRRDFGPFLLRLVVGSLFIAHLYWKFAVLLGGLPAWWSGLLKDGYPKFVPAYVLSAEVAGALLLIPGVLTRYVALYAVPMMVGAAEFWWVRKGLLHQGRRGTARGLARAAQPAGLPGRRRLRPCPISWLGSPGPTIQADLRHPGSASRRAPCAPERTQAGFRFAVG